MGLVWEETKTRTGLDPKKVFLDRLCVFYDLRGKVIRGREV